VALWRTLLTAPNGPEGGAGPWRRWSLLARVRPRIFRATGYELIARSELVPDLDFALRGAFVARTDQPAAIKEFREALRTRA
jgi:hypothetical protein